MCVKLHVVEPVKFNAPVIVSITVTPEKDIPDLGVDLWTDADAVIEGPQGWEPGVKDTKFWRGGAGWRSAAKAKVPVHFTRVIHFQHPSDGGTHTILVRAAGKASEPSVEDVVSIYLTRGGGTVYYSGTPMVITPRPAPTLPLGLVPATPLPSPTRPPYP